MVVRVEMSKDEKMALYMTLTKRKLAEMLCEANRVIDCMMREQKTYQVDEARRANVITLSAIR